MCYLADDGPGCDSSPATLVALFDHSERYFNRGRGCQSQRSPPNMKNHFKLCRSPLWNNVCIPRSNTVIYRPTHSVLSFTESAIRSFRFRPNYHWISVWSGTTHVYLSISYSCISKLQPSRSSMLWFQHAIWLIVQSYLVAVAMIPSMMILVSPPKSHLPRSNCCCMSPPLTIRPACLVFLHLIQAAGWLTRLLVLRFMFSYCDVCMCVCKDPRAIYEYND